MIKGWKKLEKWQLEHLKEAHINTEQQWQSNTYFQRRVYRMEGKPRCGQCWEIMGILGQTEHVLDNVTSA